MLLQQIKFKSPYTLIVTQEEIIFLMNRGKHLLITRSHYQNPPALRSVMKHTVQDYYTLHLLQDITWKPFPNCESHLMYRIGAMCMKVY